MSLPVLWSFRRCPYAIRARLALASSGVSVELREVVLRDKPAAFLAASPSATVPCLDTATGVIDESLEIMIWALHQNDPEGWLDMPDTDLITTCDGPFKTALDRYKYPTRYTDVDPEQARAAASDFLEVLNQKLDDEPYLFGASPKLADMAILPFVRQFAHVDLNWFDAQSWSAVIAWLGRFKTSGRFGAIMAKYPAWMPDDMPITFPQSVVAQVSSGQKYPGGLGAGPQSEKSPANKGGA
ncbi:glutathione S-transferase [Roseovarius sp. 2305UL8-3]|uniref:glutathione S-transferase n=1 Tax=Roseovarius conchicola TaxID=3121636 RepID=UPI0035291860